jgi:UV DNA damage repair endonuclease
MLILLLSLPNTYAVDTLDIEVEAKAKEQSLQHIRVLCCQENNSAIILQ